MVVGIISVTSIVQLLIFLLTYIYNTNAALMFASRRDAISQIATAAGGEVSAISFMTVASTKPCSAATITTESIRVSSTNLIHMIPEMDFGAPATNATISRELSTKIEEVASFLESGSSHSNNRNNAKSTYLSGSWRLLYSNGPEITSLAKSLPLGFTLGPTYQPLDTTSGRFENRGNVYNKFFNIAKLQTNVIGDVSVANDGTLNAIGVPNDHGNRVNVDFRCITFELDEVLGKVVGPPPLRKTLIPKISPNSAQPANDITYLDESVRIIRGGDGALFIFKREN